MPIAETYIFGDGPMWGIVGMLGGLLIGYYFSRHDYTDSD